MNNTLWPAPVQWTGMQDSSWARCPQMEGYWKKKKKTFLAFVCRWCVNVRPGSYAAYDILSFVGFEVFTAVVMKSIIFWVITLCSLLSVNRRFRGTSRLHLQGQRNKSNKQVEWLLKSLQNLLCIKKVNQMNKSKYTRWRIRSKGIKVF
jgi:hypothetical protein